MSYFKPSRRKFGVATLLLTCVLMAGWVRSYRVQDTFVLEFGTGTSVELLSACKSLIFVSAFDQSPSKPPKLNFRWMTYGFASDHWYMPIDADNANMVTSSKSAEFKSHQVILPIGGTTHYFRAFQVPYWSIVIPLTLLSALLLLSKPRPAKHAEQPITTAN